MFSRAAKSIVKTIGQRKYHAGEENIKSAVIGGAGELGQSLSQMLKQTSKLDVLALYDVAALNKRYLIPMRIKNFKDSNTAANTANSRMLTMLEKSRSNKSGEHLQTPYFSNRVSNANQYATEELVRSLRQLPIAEECAANQFARSTMESQGNHACANDLRGPRVLGEMGPATFQHSGHIVSEICRQFPDFANYFIKTLSNNDDVASTRRWYSNIALSCNVKSELDSRSPIAQFAAHFENACARRNTEKISTTTKNSHTLERMDNKNRSTKKDGKQLNVTSSDQTTKRKLFKDNENRAAMQRCDRKRNEARKCNESKIIEKTMTKVEKRSSNVEKSKNWTIPAALSDKKPKMLYGLVRQRRKPFTNFFSRFFEVRNDDLANDYYSKLGGWRIDRIDRAANRKILKESNRDKSRRRRSYRENRSNVSTSVSDLAAGSSEGTESSMIAENSRSLEQLENRTMIVQRSAESSSCDIIDGVATTTDSEPEIDTSENVSTQKISSKIALFLENLKINGQRSHSLSSLVSYNLESLFTDVEMAPILRRPTPTSILFSSSDSDCKSSIKDKLKKICGKKKSKKEDEICKKRKCKGVDAGKSCGKKNEPPACKKRDECKKQPTCDEDVEDPCKPCRSEEHHGPTCKKYKEEAKYDPCDKLWNDETHGQRCKKQQKKKKKKKTTTTTTDTCNQKREESCDTRKREKPKKSEKAKCPPVVRAPGCPQDDDKSGGTGRGSFRRYSTFDSKINANDHSDYKDISNTDESNDVSVNSQRSRQEKTRKVGLLDSNAFDVSCRYRNENFRNC